MNQKLHSTSEHETRSSIATPATSPERPIRVVTVVDRPRPGLCELSFALAKHAHESGHPVTMLHAVHDDAIPAEEWSFGRLVRDARAADVVVVWSFGRTALLLPILRLLTPNTHWSFVLHEPGGLGAKLRKQDPVLRSLVSAALEAMVCRFAHTVLVPRADRAGLVKARAVRALPLLYLEDDEASTRPREAILYCGRRDARRKAALFAEPGFRAAVATQWIPCQFEFFPPDPTRQGSMGDKWAAWHRAATVLNFYTVAYNQSGVTVEALLHGVPVVVSSHDPHSSLLRTYSLALSADASDAEIASAVASAASRQQELAPRLREVGSKLGGRIAFRETWLPWLDAVAGPAGRAIASTGDQEVMSREVV